MKKFTSLFSLRARGSPFRRRRGRTGKYAPTKTRAATEVRADRVEKQIVLRHG